MHNQDEAAAFKLLLLEYKFIETEGAQLTPLTGGVSSEIYLVQEAGRQFVVKRALEKLKVEADWFADTSRNQSEQAYMRYVHRFRPEAMPEIYRCHESAGMFSMEYLEGFSNWKQDLLAGICDISLAKQAGTLLGEIHAYSWGDESLKKQFDTMDCFDQLRVDPYLRATAAKHEELKSIILEEATRLTSNQQCLIHGDYSPKNMMQQAGRLVLLDCEVACYADAAFDLSFFLNHFLLKSLYHVPKQLPFYELVEAILASYSLANATNASEVRSRVAQLLPMLMLARVDGKSPVEYLTESKQQVVRDFVYYQLLVEQPGLKQLLSNWFSYLLKMEIE